MRADFSLERARRIFWVVIALTLVGGGAVSYAVARTVVSYRTSAGKVFHAEDDSGRVGLGDGSRPASALLAVTIPDGGTAIDGGPIGFLPPRATTTQLSGIGWATTGTQVFDTTAGTMKVWNGSSWVAMGGGSVTPPLELAVNGIGTSTPSDLTATAMIGENNTPADGGPVQYGPFVTIRGGATNYACADAKHCSGGAVTSTKIGFGWRPQPIDGNCNVPGGEGVGTCATNSASARFNLYTYVDTVYASLATYFDFSGGLTLAAGLTSSAVSTGAVTATSINPGALGLSSSEVDWEPSTSATHASAGSSYTTGTIFSAARNGMVVTGVRAFAGTAAQVKLSLWEDAGSTRMASCTVTPGSTGTTSCLFSTPQTLGPVSSTVGSYRVSIWYTSGTGGYYYIGQSSLAAKMSLSSLNSTNMGVGYNRTGGCYATGDAYPSNADTTNAFFVEPIFQ